MSAQGTPALPVAEQSNAASSRHVRRHTRAKPILASGTQAQDASSTTVGSSIPSGAEAAAIAASSAAAAARRKNSVTREGFMGLEPLATEPDEVFQKLSVKAAEEFERAVR